MKTSRIISFLAFGALTITLQLRGGSQPASIDRVAGEVPIREVAAKICANGDNVAMGTSRVMVSARLGSPNAVLHDGSWLYYGYTLKIGETAAQGERTLVVRFVQEAVSSLTLADRETVVALRQTPRGGAKDQLLAAAKRR